MNTAPNSNRKHIAIYGKTNSGKSSLMNRLLNQEISLVSELEGTTTDPVFKAMELIPVGPVLFIDTAGLNDNSALGKMRVKKTLEILTRTDLALYVMDSTDLDFSSYKEMKLKFKKYNIPYITVINKIDTLHPEELKKIKSQFQDAVFISTYENQGLEELNALIINKLEDAESEIPILGDLVPYNGKVILVVPIDSEAPKGRIILPQVQCIRDCLDHGIKSYVVRDTELESALEDIKDVDLVITDSQVFKKVDEIVPKNMKLTSFSMLFARHKGDINAFVDGAIKVRNLNRDSKILISESCSHNVSHEDIGRVKIPKMLNKYTGFDLHYEYRVGHDFPDDIEKYDLIIHCGACMINRKTVLNRVKLCKEKGIPITNYGVLIAYLTGILDRTMLIMDNNI
ncbi:MULTISPECIES: [FeFe] hydrogenase H-cluster maturation GTPase HydF [Clostridium]|uniref:Iron-only hydrogenase maturation protein HydF n=1 Tax=Clostridium cadaveris TaxID=1529 RepID=A0A1I2MLB8_9CLOT|nr:[FeFe] hydrogenase H-cluster maturation GTPase HydF [Clostridium cadaveris]MDU4953396.1 [FeFe] hydrogenase H-cluster maturation GTPase HydF [Clostridium sp.]MDM8311518.1 [FeFe] hydrogenase H-cluster maturation GTPase HydF [Clostridium cadaveris]MDY4948473.1 [FeFe] hydrogenase H-cluster maturation GTPase HydF [Clostridium cadaveris]NME64863.1 [FeFe] hydrogenase H-cluster maturation GTPase HydF [Clostridium cadaveris]NWK11541.1 [FeFe] hydrogenase H-cluster maturation GTPase HydF [Clostridium 